MKEGTRAQEMQFTFNIVPNNWKEFWSFRSREPAGFSYAGA